MNKAGQSNFREIYYWHFNTYLIQIRLKFSASNHAYYIRNRRKSFLDSYVLILGSNDAYTLILFIYSQLLEVFSTDMIRDLL